LKSGFVGVPVKAPLAQDWVVKFSHSWFSRFRKLLVRCEKLANRLNSIAKETERPRSFIIQKALDVYIEDFADLQIALDRLHGKGDEMISAKEIKKNSISAALKERNCQGPERLTPTMNRRERKI
jgi:RHH-type rel operon transcriptional repressor/antitoxin RelB